ncbi:MAG: type II toxin-antitoxin system Phd/YefM family antitoxin [Desulfobacteraceae bacterium]|nr:type II toxin-antitoxin system Phd/YefM family antitoxin [Desulfobacteraceae bacterium]
MEDFQEILPVTKVKRNLLDIVKRIEEEDETVTITRNGEPVGVMMSMGRYEALLETIEILGDREILESLAKSGKDFESGEVFQHSEVWKD